VEGNTGLALRRVVLFSSGVGFFEHAGEVRDNAKVELKFKVKDINDLLKSMVVQDLSGGRVSTVGYGSSDPLERRLSSFAVNLNGNPRLSALLEQVRGEKVEVDAPNKITGVIVGLETRKLELGKDRFIDADVLNLLTDEGLRSVTLESCSRIKLVNERLDAEIRKALTVLAGTHATDKKTVTINFQGAGRRNVRIGYVEEAPVWKTSYRLEVGSLEAGAAGREAENRPAGKKATLLQGWAIVENPTEEDWNDVRLALVSGRPISFTMDLYSPLYIPRPEVELERFASLRPPAYEQDLARREQEFGKKAAAMSDRAGQAQLGRARAALRALPAPAAPMAATAGAAMEGKGMAGDRDAEQALDLGRGVQSAATAANVGELFQYAITTPVTLSRHESAMLPIVNEPVQAEKLSIYDPAVQPKHPLCALRLTNSTDLHLMQGPITVFDGGVYAGDATIADLAPGGQRLVSYALDLDTEVAPESTGRPEQLVSVRLVKGTLIAEQKHARAQQYTIKNSSRVVKNVLIEYPHDPSWTLVAPKEPAEKTRDKYRFAVEARPGVPAKLVVEEERTDSQHIALSNLEPPAIEIYLGAKAASDKVKQALADVIKRKQALAEVVQRRGQLEQQIRTIGEEQSRIRENMARLDHNTDLYKRYVKKFSDQEDEIERYRGQIKEFSERETKLRKDLDEYLIGLSLD
jgi:hypothetical protein